MQSKILVIYTGGTIGMVENSDGSLNPFDFKHLAGQIPEIRRFDFVIESISFDPVIDSSDMKPEIWVKLAKIIEANYEEYDGFVILHGTDTMSFTASALSFMLENLSKPVILTGSQLPIGRIRTDGKENFITALEIAAAKHEESAMVPEVCIYFEYHLFRGNRTHKYNAEHFEAFRSVNYPALAKAGVDIKYNRIVIQEASYQEFRIFTRFDPRIAVLPVFPGIREEVVSAVLNVKGLKSVILQTFGSGNAPTASWFMNSLEKAMNNGLIIFNVTQCRGGAVNMGKYETSNGLKKIGVTGGYDITLEAAIAKLMYLHGNEYSRDRVRKYLQVPLRGEMTVH